MFGKNELQIHIIEKGSYKLPLAVTPFYSKWGKKVKIGIVFAPKTGKVDLSIQLSISAYYVTLEQLLPADVQNK